MYQISTIENIIPETFCCLGPYPHYGTKTLQVWGQHRLSNEIPESLRLCLALS